MGPAARRLAAWAWLLLCVAVIGGLAAEVTLRVQRQRLQVRALAFAAANPFHHGRDATEGAAQTLWEEPWRRYRPGATLEREAGGRALRIRINRQGFRGVDFALPKPPGRLRVACIGGSTTFQGWTDDTTYPARLEALLREHLPGRDLDVLNLGISGTRSGHWLEHLDELLRFEPDLVVQYDGVNDVAWEHLRLLSKQRPLRRRANESLLVAELLPLQSTALDRFHATSFERFVRLRDALAARGIRHVIGTFAMPDTARAEPGFREYLDLDVEQQWGRRMRLRRYATFAALMARFNERLVGIAARHGLALVRVDAELQDPTLFVDSCHLTPAGVERLAQAFLPAVAAGLEAGGRDAPAGVGAPDPTPGSVAVGEGAGCNRCAGGDAAGSTGLRTSGPTCSS